MALLWQSRAAAVAWAQCFLLMRWMLVAFLVSLVALLIAAAGVARHIWQHRQELKRQAAEEAELETES